MDEEGWRLVATVRKEMGVPTATVYRLMRDLGIQGKRVKFGSPLLYLFAEQIASIREEHKLYQATRLAQS